MANYNFKVVDEFIATAETAADALEEYCIVDAACISIDEGAEFDEAVLLAEMQMMIKQLRANARNMRSAYFGS